MFNVHAVIDTTNGCEYETLADIFLTKEEAEKYIGNEDNYRIEIYKLNGELK